MLLALCPLAFSLSCEDDSEEIPPEPPGPVAFALAELRPRGADTWKPGDAEPVVIGCDSNLGVTVVIYDPLKTPDGAPPDPHAPEYLDGDWRGDWLVRPPGACGQEQCGPVRVTVEAANGESVTTEAALETVVVDLAPLGDAIDGPLRIQAELFKNGGVPATKRGELLADELEIEAMRETCPDGEGGAGGAPTGGTGGTSGDAGASGTGEQGGQGGAGAPGTGGTAGASSGAGGAPGGAPGEAGGGGV